MRSSRAAVRRIGPPVGVVIAAVALLAIVVALVNGATPGIGIGAPQAQETPTEEPTDTSTDTSTEPPLDVVEARVASYEVFLARDPFEPVVPQVDTTATSGGAPAAPTTPGTPTSPASPTSSPSPAPATTEAPTESGCVSNGSVTCDGLTVSLVDVFGEGDQAGAVVRVDEAIYEVSAGETFATSFRVLSIEPPCVTLQYGDDRFSLCEGESVLK